MVDDAARSNKMSGSPVTRLPLQNRKHTIMIRAPNGADNPRRLGRREGQRRKDEAHTILEARRDRFLMQARRELLGVALERDTASERGRASADDVRERLKLPADIGPVCLGAVPKPLALAGIIRRIGFVTSARPEAHARPVSQWELVDPDAARQWLVDHPAPTPVDEPASPARTQLDLFTDPSPFGPNRSST